MANAKKCFMCEENPRLDGDFMCRSCKEEHPMCYECGHRKRNLPFKLCTKCYQKSRGGAPIDDVINIADNDGCGDGDLAVDGVANIMDGMTLSHNSGV